MGKIAEVFRERIGSGGTVNADKGTMCAQSLSRKRSSQIRRMRSIEEKAEMFAFIIICSFLFNKIGSDHYFTSRVRQVAVPTDDVIPSSFYVPFTVG